MTFYCTTAIHIFRYKCPPNFFLVDAVLERRVPLSPTPHEHHEPDIMTMTTTPSKVCGNSCLVVNINRIIASPSCIHLT